MGRQLPGSPSSSPTSISTGARRNHRERWMKRSTCTTDGTCPEASLGHQERAVAQRDHARSPSTSPTPTTWSGMTTHASTPLERPTPLRRDPTRYSATSASKSPPTCDGHGPNNSREPPVVSAVFRSRDCTDSRRRAMGPDRLLGYRAYSVSTFEPRPYCSLSLSWHSRAALLAVARKCRFSAFTPFLILASVRASSNRYCALRSSPAMRIAAVATSSTFVSPRVASNGALSTQPPDKSGRVRQSRCAIATGTGSPCSWSRGMASRSSSR